MIGSSEEPRRNCRRRSCVSPPPRPKVTAPAVIVSQLPRCASGVPAECQRFVTAPAVEPRRACGHLRFAPAPRCSRRCVLSRGYLWMGSSLSFPSIESSTLLGIRFEIVVVIVYAGFGFEAFELVLIPDGSLGSRCDLYELVV